MLSHLHAGSRISDNNATAFPRCLGLAVTNVGDATMLGTIGFTLFHRMSAESEIGLLRVTTRPTARLRRHVRQSENGSRLFLRFGSLQPLDWRRPTLKPQSVDFTNYRILRDSELLADSLRGQTLRP